MTLPTTGLLAIYEWCPWMWEAFPDRALLYWFLGMHKVNESVFLALWHHSASDQDLFVTCYWKAPACLVFVTGIWITLWGCSMTAGEIVFIILGGRGCLSPLPRIVYVSASSPSVLWMDSKLFLGGNAGDNSNFSCSSSGDWFGPCIL